MRRWPASAGRFSAESAQYQYPAGASPVPVRAYVDRSMQQMGDLATDHGSRTHRWPVQG